MTDAPVPFAPCEVSAEIVPPPLMICSHWSPKPLSKSSLKKVSAPGVPVVPCDVPSLVPDAVSVVVCELAVSLDVPALVALDVSTAVDVVVALVLLVPAVDVAVEVAVDVDVGEVVCVDVCIDVEPVLLVVAELVLVVVAPVDVVSPLVVPLVMVSELVCPWPHPRATLAAIKQGSKATREARALRPTVTGAKVTNDCAAKGAGANSRCSRKLMIPF